MDQDSSFTANFSVHRAYSNTYEDLTLNILQQIHYIAN